MILRLADGETNSAVARHYRVSRQTVTMWRTRYRERGVAGLHNELKPGRPRSTSEEQIAELIRIEATGESKRVLAPPDVEPAAGDVVGARRPVRDAGGRAQHRPVSVSSTSWTRSRRPRSANHERRAQTTSGGAISFRKYSLAAAQR